MKDEINLKEEGQMDNGDKSWKKVAIDQRIKEGKIMKNIQAKEGSYPVRVESSLRESDVDGWLIPSPS